MPVVKITLVVYMLFFQTPQELRNRSIEIENATSLHEVIELSCIAVQWNTKSEDAEEMKVAYAKLRETALERIISFTDIQAKQIESITEKDARLAMIESHRQFEWPALKVLAKEVYERTMRRIIAVA